MANHYITAQGEELPELCVQFEVRLGPIQVGWSRSPQGTEHNECWSHTENCHAVKSVWACYMPNNNLVVLPHVQLKSFYRLSTRDVTHVRKCTRPSPTYRSLVPCIMLHLKIFPKVNWVGTF